MGGYGRSNKSNNTEDELNLRLRLRSAFISALWGVTGLVRRILSF